MKKIIFLMMMLQFLVGCANSYALHNRKEEFIWFKDPSVTHEKSEIVAKAGLVLTPDRTPVVRLDPQLSDGSAWVYYRINLKNTNSKSVNVDLNKLYIFYADEKASAVLEKEEKNTKSYNLDAKTSYQIPVKFYLKKELIEKNKGHEPVKVILPLENDEMISMELWLWHV